VNNAAPDKVSRVLKVRGALLERAIESLRLLLDGTAPTMPAWERYNGVVWSHLDPATLDDDVRRRVLVPSGLYGMNCGSDDIADYRLTMKVNLGNLGNLAHFWRPTLTRLIEEMSEATFVNFLPQEHDAAIAESLALTERTVRVSFLRHGGAGVVGHDAKAVKGVVARKVLEHGVASIDGFRWKGWRGRIYRGHYEVRAPRESRQR
jgi:cytoplasmic iron level regulating protein YaaA (DUF328/UPF0246 family)